MILSLSKSEKVEMMVDKAYDKVINEWNANAMALNTMKLYESSLGVSK